MRRRWITSATTPVSAETGGSVASDGVERADTDDPVEILQRRYAAGELSEDEFERGLDRLLETDVRASDTVNDAFESEFESE